jgi:hypothetical protein
MSSQHQILSQEEAKMKTIIATAALTVMFLSAGAFAGSNSDLVHITAPAVHVTLISKNSQWPVRGALSTDACSLRRCIAI